MESVESILQGHGKHPGDFNSPTEKQLAYYHKLCRLCHQRKVPVRGDNLITRRDYALAIGFIKNDLGLLSQTEKAKQRRAARAARATAGIPRGYWNRRKHELQGGEAP